MKTSCSIRGFGSLGLSQSGPFLTVLRGLLATVCTLCLGATTLASVQTPNELNGLRIDVEVAKTSVLIGEPLIVTLRLTNTGDDTLNISARINEIPFGMPVSLVFLGPGQERVGWQPPFQVDMLPPPEMRQLKRADYVLARFNLAASANPIGKRGGPPVLEWTFRNAGSYAVVGRYRVTAGWGEDFWHGTIESEPAWFQVREPEGVDKLAFDKLNNKFVMSQYIGFPYKAAPARESLRKIISDFPSSTYAVYADYYLGIRLLSHDVAIEHLREFIADHPDFPLIADAHFWIADLLYRLGKFEEARAQLALASERYPHDGHTADRNATQMRDPARDIEMSETIQRARRHDVFETWLNRE